MDIEYFQGIGGELLRLNVQQAGDSVAYAPPRRAGAITLMLLPIGGKAKIQYTLGTKEQVEAGTASWYDWSHGYVTAAQGSVFDTPIAYFRIVVEDQATSYKIEALQ